MEVQFPPRALIILRSVSGAWPSSTLRVSECSESVSRYFREVETGSSILPTPTYQMEHLTGEFVQFQQKKTWDCGIGVYASILDKFDKNIDKWKKGSWNKIKKKLGSSPKTGTNHKKFSPALSRDNIPHTEINQCTAEYLELELAKGSFFLVGYQSVAGADDKDERGNIFTNFKKLKPSANYEWGHYALIVGQTDTEFIPLEPDSDKPIDGMPIGYRKIPKNIFEERWYDIDSGVPYDKWAIEFKTRKK